jgi:hypothetical protein
VEVAAACLRGGPAAETDASRANTCPGHWPRK